MKRFLTPERVLWLVRIILFLIVISLTAYWTLR